MRGFPSLVHLVQTSGDLWVALGRFIRTSLRARTALAAETLCLRKQLALSQKRDITPRRASEATRVTLVLLARCFPWKPVLRIVQPATLIRGLRKGFKLFWWWRSTARGRPRVPADLRTLIGTMAENNATWGERRIAAELLLKLGIRLWPRTVRRYMPPGTGGGRGVLRAALT
jgi:putative transposase